MGVEITGNRLHWSRPSIPHCSSSSHSSLFSPIFVSAKRIKGIDVSDHHRSLACQIGRRSPFLGTTSAKLSRRRSLEDVNANITKIRNRQSLPRASSADLHGASNDEADDEFMTRLQELGVDLQEYHNYNDNTTAETFPDCTSSSPLSSSVRKEMSPSAEPPWPAICPEPPKWLNEGEIMPASLEMRANRVDLPLSLRIIKRKKRWEEGFKEAGESACCSIKKAFSSMVFIVRELQSYTLHMREILFYENLQGILARVQGEMNASFVWLFQQIFSCTPTFMVYVMLLLANFTVYSIGHNSAIAAVSSSPSITVEQEYQRTQLNSRFDASSIKSFSVGRTASVGGSGSGGGKVKPVAGATDDGRSDGTSSSSSSNGQTIVVPADGIPRTGPERSEDVMEEEPMFVWSKIVEEASRLQASLRGEALMDSDTLRQLVSPVSVELEPEDHSVYSLTELMYLQALYQDPDNGLLLSNFAQFLFLVLHDHDRAEYYFKRAVGAKPTDAEALYRYAMFLWIAKKDLEAAEEAYMEALDADPGNSHYAANYAHFLWNTGGEDTCYPLDDSVAC